ncbi:MAG: glycine/D-amino acid oxidase-like deaminating enzyme [Rhodothermales bacterium]|jgi:glycine/D-amino acid oxidase-like deaminating enzyme
MQQPTVIVGGGLAGVCAALALSREAPLLLADIPTAEGASRNAVAGLAHPVMSIRASVVWKGAEALDSLDRLALAIGAAPLQTGVIRPAKSWDQVDAFRTRVEKSPELARFHTPAASSSAWPWLRSPMGTLEMLRGGSYDIPNLLDLALTELQDRGASIRADWKLAGWKEEPDGVQATFDAPDGRHVVRCGLLVLAMGAGITQFPETSSLRLHPIKGQLIRVRAETPAGLLPVSGLGYVVQSGRDVVIGSTYEHSFQHAAPVPEDAVALLDRAVDHLPWLRGAEVLEHRAGVRVTVPGTRLPMVGPLPGHTKTWIISGLGSRGLLMAPWIAESLAGWFSDPSSAPRELAIKLDAR